MRLSDAIALGRVTISEMKGGSLRGCALGMACNAVGIDPKEAGADYEKVKAKWPWLKEIIKSPISGEYKQAVTAVWHIFDLEVMLRKRWTLDQLIDWVRSVEPAEPEESKPVVRVSTLLEHLAVSQ